MRIHGNERVKRFRENYELPQPCDLRHARSREESEVKGAPSVCELQQHSHFCLSPNIFLLYLIMINDEIQ